MISLKDTLKEMDKKDSHGKPIPFSIEFWTANRKMKTGGDLLKIDSAVLSKNSKEKEITTGELVENKNSKSPSHWENSTRNLLITSSREIRKCHIRLIESFNGQKVYW